MRRLGVLVATDAWLRSQSRLRRGGRRTVLHAMQAARQPSGPSSPAAAHYRRRCRPGSRGDRGRAARGSAISQVGPGAWNPKRCPIGVSGVVTSRKPGGCPFRRLPLMVRSAETVAANDAVRRACLPAFQESGLLPSPGRGRFLMRRANRGTTVTRAILSCQLVSDLDLGGPSLNFPAGNITRTLKGGQSCNSEIFLRIADLIHTVSFRLLKRGTILQTHPGNASTSSS